MPIVANKMNITHNHPPLFVANSRVRKVASISTYACEPIRCARLSPDGKFLAVGSDDGFLEIRMYESGVWKRVGLYTSGAAIRAMVWHPSEPATIFFGAANGNIHKITVIVDGIDLICDGIVRGFVHALAMSADGRTLVIAHGRSISVVNDPFPQSDDLGTLVGLQVEHPDHESNNIMDRKIPRGVYFLPGGGNAILVSCLGANDVCVYSTVESTQVWSLPLRPGTIVGSSAVSPSGDRLAIMNLIDGIDFYSISHRCFSSTTRYTMSRRNPGRNYLVDMIFVDDETVAFGHSDGYVAFATYGLPFITGSYKPDGDDLMPPLQTITFGVVNHLPCVFGLVSSHRTNGFPNRWVTDIHVGQIDIPNNSHGIAQYVQPPRLVEIPTQLPVVATQLPLVSTHLRKLTKKEVIVLTGSITLILAIFWSFRSERQSSADISPMHATGTPIASPTSGNSNVCFCTIPGTVAPGA